MANMSCHDLAQQPQGPQGPQGLQQPQDLPDLQGFSVYQPALGAPLLFFPALGTKELDLLIDTYVAGPASCKEKRAAISVDFFEHSRLTGDSFKFYTVDMSQVPLPTPVPSSASSSASPWDSPIFDMSPALSDVTAWSFGSLPQQQQPASIAGSSRPRQQAKPRPTKKSPSAPTSGSIPAKKTTTDFSNLPGMKILTTDGRDVTNSASRGCKTKEQRDHAHLMRIIKACDTCKRKKIRCDPSHKKRTASQAQAQSEPKPVKKARKVVVESPVALVHSSVATPQAPAFDFECDPSLGQLPIADASSPDDFWEEFVRYEQELNVSPIDNDFLTVQPDDFSPIASSASAGLSSSSMSSSSSSPSSYQPRTPPPAPSDPGLFDPVLDAPSQQLFHQEPSLPYLDAYRPGDSYADFNLYSPPSSFLNEEPVQLKSSQVSRLASEDVAHINASDSSLQARAPNDLCSGLDDPALLSLAADEPQMGTGSEALIPSHSGTDGGVLRRHREPGESIGGNRLISLPYAENAAISWLSLRAGGATRPVQSQLSTASDVAIVEASPRPSVLLASPPDVHQPASSTDLPSTSELGAYGNIASPHVAATTTLSVDATAPGDSFSVANPPASASQAGVDGRLRREIPTSIARSLSVDVESATFDFTSARGESVGADSHLPVTVGQPSISPFGTRQSVSLAAPSVKGVSWSVEGSDSEHLLDTSLAESVPASAMSVVGGQLLLASAGMNHQGGSSALVAVVAALVMVVSWLVIGVLTLQAGSALMPEGLFGLVIGGALAVWRRTPPRSSKPVPEAVSSAGVVGVGAWLNGQVNQARCFIRRLKGEKIDRFSRSQASQVLVGMI